MIKNKQAKGHVEIIISFVIFIGFLIFLLTFFGTFKSGPDNTLIEKVFTNMEEQLRTDVTSISISLTAQGLDNIRSKNCFSIPDIPDLECSNNQIVVKDKIGNQISSRINGNIEIQKSTDKFYTIYCSDELQSLPPPGDCSTILTEVENNIGDYTLGVIIKRKIWSEKKIIQFLDDYNSNYVNVRESIVPVGNDFGFSIWDLNDLDTPLYDGDQSRSGGIRVDARTLSIEIVNQDANIAQHTIGIRVW